jgi:hypothetical protein
MTDYRVHKGEASEDQVTAAIEKVTSKVPSSAYLAAAVGSMVASFTFKLSKKEHAALFVGQWAAPLLLLGIYNKLVKLHGSDSNAEYARPGELAGAEK